MPNDAVAAVAEYLTGLAEGRVWGASLPGDESQHMPRTAIIVRAAGGSGAYGGGYMPTVDDRIDLRCYGPDPWAAKQLANTAARLMHAARDEATSHGRIIWARSAGRPSDTTEPDTAWPLALVSFQVFGPWLD